MTALIELDILLAIPHSAQQLLSSDNTPTLSLVLPVYESLVQKLRQAQSDIPHYWFAIQKGLDKIEKYVAEAHRSDAYIFAMRKVSSQTTHYAQSNVYYQLSTQSLHQDAMDDTELDC